jgi:hypothetical protein
MTLATADAEHARRGPAKVPTAVAQDAAGLRARQVCVRGGATWALTWERFADAEHAYRPDP